MKAKPKAKVIAKVFGDIDLWDFINKDDLKQELGLTDDEWDSYDLMFQIKGKKGSSYATVVGY